MKRFNSSILILMGWLLIPAYCVTGQQTAIEGTITDGSGNPVHEATVSVIEKPDLQAKSDEKGRFNIDAEVGQHLQVKHKGGVSKTLEISSEQLTISLTDTPASEIPVGYGTTRSSDELTGAVGTVNFTDLSKSMAINPENTLYGQVPGLMVLENGGLPLSGPDIYIRGSGTFTDARPLVLVDGFEQPISAISMDEIQTVSVLKDAGALTQYGQRGANGVVLVTTKRGNRGGLNVKASYEQAFTQPTHRPEFLGAYSYAQAINEARKNDGLEPRYSTTELNAFKTGNSPYLYPNVDWFDKVLRNSGTNSNYNISFRGGGKTVRYFTSMNVAFENGIFGPVDRNKDYSTQAKYSRFNFRTNLNVDITSRLSLRLDVSGNLEENNLPGGGGGTYQIFDALYSIPSAAFPVTTPDGSWGGTQNYDNNPMAILTSTGYGQPNRREYFMTVNLRRDLDEILDGLSVEGTFRYNSYNNFAESQTKSFSYQALSPESDTNGNITGIETTTYGEDTDLKFNSFFSNKREFTDLLSKFNYEQTFGKNNTFEGNILVHQSARVYEGRDNTYHRRNFVGSARFGFSSKYFVDVVASYSGNNLLPAGKKYSFLPAISGGWLISKEDFLQDLGFLDRLKLRASLGMTGSDRIPSNNPYEQGYYSAVGYRFQNGNNYKGGFARGRLPSSDLSIETSYNLNAGFEARMFNKFTVTSDFFYNYRVDILTWSNGQTSNVIGFNHPLESAGRVENKGVETSLVWQDNVGGLAYHIGGQVTFSRNRILEMNETYLPEDYLKRTGKPVGQNFGMEAIGFFEDQADIENSPRQVFSAVQPGDIKYKDQNGDGIVNEFDTVPIGYSSQHPEIYFSTTLGAEYKGFSLSALFQGTANYTAYLNTQSVFWPLRNNNTISEHYYENRWTVESGNDAFYPRLTTESNVNNFRPNSIWLADRSYIKLRTLEVSYTLPAAFTEQWNMRKVKILGRGMNLFSIDNIPVLDPERLSTGYPILRSYNLGLEIAF